MRNSATDYPPAKQQNGDLKHLWLMCKLITKVLLSFQFVMRSEMNKNVKKISSKEVAWQIHK